jgi:hypothetical protein
VVGRETATKPGNARAQGGGAGNLGAGGVAGPTAAAAAQRQRSLLQRPNADIGSLLDNFSHLLKAARVGGIFYLVSLSCAPRPYRNTLPITRQGSTFSRSTKWRRNYTFYRNLLSLQAFLTKTHQLEEVVLLG